MSAQTFAAIEAGGYALAAILLMATAIYFFTRHVLAVRDELTGRAARRAIEELRSGGISRPVADMARGGGRGASESGSLHVRFAGRTSSRRATTGPRRTGGMAAPRETGSVAPGGPAPAPATTAPSEAGTTLLAADAPSESGTTLLAADAAPSEAGTTLLSADAPSEAGTTLLTGGGEDDR